MTEPTSIRSLEQAVPDPVLSAFELPLRRMYYPLGYGLEVATNSIDVIEAADENWGWFVKAFDTPPMHMWLGVVPSEQQLPATSRILSREHLMSIVADSDNSIVCDFSKNFA